MGLGPNLQAIKVAPRPPTVTSSSALIMAIVSPLFHPLPFSLFPARMLSLHAPLFLFNLHLLCSSPSSFCQTSDSFPDVAPLSSSFPSYFWRSLLFQPLLPHNSNLSLKVLHVQPVSDSRPAGRDPLRRFLLPSCPRRRAKTVMTVTRTFARKFQFDLVE